MAPVLTPQGLVLAGFIPGDLVRLRDALSLPDEAFIIREDVFLFRLYREYWRVHRGMLPVQYIADRLKNEPAASAKKVAERFAVLKDTEVEDHLFEWAKTSVHESWRDDEARGALHKAINIMVGAGAVEEGEAVRGYGAMRASLARSFQRIDQLGQGAIPEALLSDSADSMLSQIGAAGRQTSRFHFPTGVDALDELLPYGGPASGEVWMIAGYAGEGKTTFCTTTIAYGALMSGLNVVYLTGETLLDEVEFKMALRHSRHPKFGWPTGVDSMRIRQENPPPAEVDIYQAAVLDLTGNAGYTHGQLVIQQMPMRNTVDGVLETLERYEASWPVHVLVVDSVDMVRSAEKSYGYRDALGSVIEDFASLAVSYDNGRGLIVVTPWQIKRIAYEAALENKGRYDLSALSETAMAERRASVVLSLLALPESPGQVRAQMLKNRYGPKAEFMLEVNFRTAFMGAAAGVSSQTSGMDMF